MTGNRAGTTTTATAPADTNPIKHEEAGLPTTGAAAPANLQGDPNYNNQIPLQSQPMQQQGYPQQNNVPQNYPQQTDPQGLQPQYTQQPYQQSQPMQQRGYSEYSTMTTQQPGGEMPQQMYPQQPLSPPPQQSYLEQPNNLSAPREGTREMQAAYHEAPKPSVSPEVVPARGSGMYAGT